MGRVGTKRSDRRWEDENGVWASKLESLVFARLLKVPGIRVRRCDPEAGDTFDYHTLIRSGVCGSCGSSSVVQQRTYTPDFHITPDGPGRDGRGFYLETKGYFPGEQRNLLRAFLKTGPKVDLRLVLERDGRATRSLTQVEYAVKYLKIPVHVWDGVLPKPWLEELK
jgi:hypothetical protein